MNLDLDAVLPPRAPRNPTVMLSFRTRASIAVWVREQARLERTNVARYLQGIVERAYRGGYPADVRDWLAAQAAQCGRPGDLDGALCEVVRHLAVRWPQGGRLLPIEDAPSRRDELAKLRAQVQRLKAANRKLRESVTTNPSPPG